MARVWMEGFEDGIPHGHYIEGTPNTPFISGLSYTSGYADTFPTYITISTGRNAYSARCMKINNLSGGTFSNVVAVKTLSSALSELYFRTWFKHGITETNSDTNDVIWLETSGTTRLIGIFSNGLESFSVKVNIGGSYASVGNFVIPANTWAKLEIYLKVDSSTGAYEVRLNNASIYSDTGVNTGSTAVALIKMGCGASSGTNVTKYDLFYDDIAINDTTGAKNNTWCGDGTIVGLKPKASGNYSDWSTSQGWALAENGTTTTNIEITGHGLATDDVIYNATKGVYRLVTKVDDNNLTVSSVTDQAENDIIVGFAYAATITAGSGTSTSKVVLSGHTLESYEVFVNASRSNAIRRAIYISGTSVFNAFTNNADYPGSTVTSQASGDSIKTFKVKYFPITDHYKAVYSAIPNPIYSNIQSGTSGQKDTFDMEELVADKSVPANAGIIAVSHNTYAKEKGAGSQYNPLFRISSSDYTGDAITLISGTLEYQQIYEDSPATSTTWSLSEVDSLEAGVKVV